MDELTIPRKRGGSVFAIVMAVFTIPGLAVITFGISIVAGGSANGYLFIVTGSVLTLIFGAGLVSAIQQVRSPGLRLDADGFELDGRLSRWADVSDLYFVPGKGESSVDRVCVVYVAGVKRRRAVNDIPVDSFDTGGPALEDILRSWWRGDRSVGRPVERAYTEPELVLAPDRSDSRGALVIAVPLFVLVVAAGPGLLLYALLVDHEQPTMWNVVLGTFAWLAVSVFFGASVHFLRQGLQSPSLILHRNGFEYGEHAWAWSDITAVEPFEDRVRVVFRPRRSPSSAPSRLPFRRDGFKTAGRPVDDILREWLDRYVTDRDDVS